MGTGASKDTKTFAATNSTHDQAANTSRVMFEENIAGSDFYVETSDEATSSDKDAGVVITDWKVGTTPRLVGDNHPSPAERLLRQPTADQILRASNMQSARAKRNRGKQNQNLKFYKNELSSKPAPGSTIKDMLRWKGDYKFLEEHGYYMQWLFPIPDTTGVNEHAQPLCPHEIQAIRGDKTLQHRFLGAYKMMLDLYGLQLNSERNGTVCHAANWSRRYAFLDSSKKAHKQITRIIKALESFGFQHFQQPLVCFLLNETFSERRLNIPVESFQVWISMMADDNEKIACVTIMDELVGT